MSTAPRTATQGEVDLPASQADVGEHAIVEHQETLQHPRLSPVGGDPVGGWRAPTR